MTLLVRLPLLLLILSFSLNVNASQFKLGKSYERNELQKIIRDYIGLEQNAILMRVTTRPIPLSLSGKNIELLTAEDSCGTAGCQFFIVERYAEGNKVKFRLLADFFGRFTVLEKSTRSFRQIQVSADIGGIKSGYILEFNGEYFARK